MKKIWNVLSTAGYCFLVNLLVVLTAAQPLYGFYPAESNACPLAATASIPSNFDRQVQWDAILQKHPSAEPIFEKMKAHAEEVFRYGQMLRAKGLVPNDADAEKFGNILGEDIFSLDRALESDSPLAIGGVEKLSDFVEEYRKNHVSGKTAKEIHAASSYAAQTPAEKLSVYSATDEVNRKHASDVAAMQEKIAALKKEIADARGLKRRAEELKSQKKNGASDSKENLKDLESQLKEQENRLKNLRKETAEIQKRIASLKESLDAQGVKTSEKYEAALKEFSAKQMEIEGILKIINGDPAFPLAAKYRELNDLQKQAAAKEEKIVPVASVDNPDAALIAKLKQEADALKTQIEPLRAELEPKRGLRWKIAYLQNQIFLADSQEEKAPFESELKSVQGDIAKYEEEQEKISKEISMLDKDQELILEEKIKAQRSGAENQVLAEFDARLNQAKDDTKVQKAMLAVIKEIMDGSFEDAFLEKSSTLTELEDALSSKEQVIAVLSAATPAQALGRVAKMSPLSVKEVAEARSYADADVAAFMTGLHAKFVPLKTELESQVNDLKGQKTALEHSLAELDKNQTTVQASPEVEEKRNKIRCALLSIDVQIKVAEILLRRDLKIAEEYQTAEVEFLQRWRAEKQKLTVDIASGAIRRETFNDVEDIGHRANKKGPGREENKFFDPKAQMDDIKISKNAIDQARAMHLFNEYDGLYAAEIVKYVESLLNRIKPHSDMAVDPHVILLQTATPNGGLVVNAAALPGGFFLVEVGLIRAARNEAELVGVLCHEIGHVTAGHGRRLQKKAMFAQMGLQAAYIFLSVALPGLFQAASYAAYYLKGLLIQVIMSGVELAIFVPLLGILRSYEAEADRLGVEYASTAGWDPRGFINFFDLMARHFGDILHTSWFATHPAFADRYFATMRETEFMDAAFPGRKANYIVDEPEFQIQKRLLGDALKHSVPKKKGPKDPTLKKKGEQDPACEAESKK